MAEGLLFELEMGELGGCEFEFLFNIWAQFCDFLGGLGHRADKFVFACFEHIKFVCGIDKPRAEDRFDFLGL